MFHLNLYNINTGKTHYVSAKPVTYVTSIIKIELLVQCTIQISAQFNSAVLSLPIVKFSWQNLQSYEFKETKKHAKGIIFTINKKLILYFNPIIDDQAKHQVIAKCTNLWRNTSTMCIF